MDLYQELNGQQQSQTQQQNNNFAQGLLQFAQNFRGDPVQQVMNLIQQKGIPQDQLNTAIQQTNQFYSQLNGRR